MKKVFITGASSGLGLAIATQYALQFKTQGIVLGLVGRNTEALNALAYKLTNEYGAVCRIYTLDVRDIIKINEAAINFIEQYGVPNIVIASAGVSRGTLTENIADIPAFKAIMDINVMGLIHTFHPFIDVMRQNKTEQRILVGIASVAGIRGLPGAGAYSASKAAAINYLESLRIELQKDDIHVTTIAPGYIRTPMTDINTYKMPFLMDAIPFAKKCISKIENKHRFVVIPWQMGWLARLMRLIPPSLWDLLMRNAPHKERTDWDWI
jgi:short-subunit dehydrogenase